MNGAQILTLEPEAHMKSHPELQLRIQAPAELSYAAIIRSWTIVGLTGFVIAQGIGNSIAPIAPESAGASAWIPSVWSLGFLGLVALAAGIHILRAHSHARWKAVLDAVAEREMARSMRSRRRAASTPKLAS